MSASAIFAYQDRGLLPPPKILGRTGWYSEEHLVRLKLISGMLDRGYTFATISELARRPSWDESGTGAAGTPKSGRFRNFKRAATITITELRNSLGASDRTIALSQKLGLLTKDGAHYAIRNPEVLEGAEVLVKSGIELTSCSTAGCGCRTTSPTSRRVLSPSSPTSISTRICPISGQGDQRDG